MTPAPTTERDTGVNSADTHRADADRADINRADTRPPATAAGTATGPTAASVWRSVRVPLLVAVLVVVAAVLVGVANGRGARGALDPAAAEPAGSRALAALLRDGGVQVDRARTVREVLSRADSTATVFVPFPDRLPPGQLDELARLPAGTRLVLVDPGSAALRTLAPGVEHRSDVEVGGRAAACELPAAQVAGVVDLGGGRYDVTAAETAESTAECYASGGAATLVQVTGTSGRTVTVVGAGVLFTNDRLDERGNAALALGVLGTADRVLWLLPGPFRAADPGQRQADLFDLLPDRLLLAILQFGVGVVLIVLWRARRLGPVVREPLPVVVRSAEAVEGRGRLYRAAQARDRAAQELRAGAAARLSAVLGLGADHSGEGLAAAVERRTGRPAVELTALLYGAPPPDDTALVRLADDLDTLDREVRRP